MAVAYAREVLKWNHGELDSALESASDALQLDLGVSVRLHNYAASVYSLLSAFRRALPARERQRIPDAEHFDERLDRTFHDELGCFVLALRDYCQHYRNPIEFSFVWGDRQSQGGPERRLGLQSEPLLLYLEGRTRDRKKSKAAARYVRSSGPAIDIWEVAAGFAKSLADFDVWFDEWYTHTYQVQLDDLTAAEWEVAYALLAWRLELWTLEREVYPGHIVEPFLAADVGLNRVAVILDEPERIVLQELNRNHPVDQDLEELIRRTFGLWAEQTGWAEERGRRRALGELG